MDDSPVERLRAYLAANEVEAEIVDPGRPMPTVPLAAAAIGVEEDRILKSLLFTDGDGTAVLVIANGARRVDRQKLAAATGLSRPRLADPETVLRLTGFPAGGVAPIGHKTTIPVVIDQHAAVLETAYGGGGAEHLLLKIAPADIARLTSATVADVVSPSSG